MLTDSGDVVRESVGPFAAMVLAEGDYTVIANNRGGYTGTGFADFPGSGGFAEWTRVNGAGGGPVALCRQLGEAGAPRGHESDFRHRKQAIDQDQQQDKQNVHKAILGDARAPEVT